MIKVFIPKDAEFKKYEKECSELYDSLQDKICDTNSFEFVVNNTLFYLFTDDEILIGGIYYFLDDGKLFVNAFAKRKRHEICLKCFRMSLNWFKGSIYAEAQNRASALCLLKCGFKRQNGKIFVYQND